MKTNSDIWYRPAFSPGKGMLIPKGTKVVPAANLPEPGRFWAEPWDGMTDEASSWQRNYGFLLTVEDLGLTCQCALNPLFCDIH